MQNVIFVLLPCFCLHQFANTELGWFVLQGLLVPVSRCFIADFLLTYSGINKSNL